MHQLLLRQSETPTGFGQYKTGPEEGKKLRYRKYEGRPAIDRD
jgi:hypothetical protein